MPLKAEKIAELREACRTSGKLVKIDLATYIDLVEASGTEDPGHVGPAKSLACELVSTDEHRVKEVAKYTHQVVEMLDAIDNPKA